MLVFKNTSVAMLTLKPIHWVFIQRYVTEVATEQMLAQQQVWRRSQLAALSAASLTGYISYTGSIKNKPENLFSLWNDLKMLWCWDKYLCQRVSIKNLDTTARLWSSRRVSEIPRAASFCLIWTIDKLVNLECSWAVHRLYIKNKYSHFVYNKCATDKRD